MGPQPDMDILPHYEGYCTRSVEVSTSRSRADFVYNVKFEVIGSPFSLLPVSLSASQNLYIRKGSLFGEEERLRMSANLDCPRFSTNANLRTRQYTQELPSNSVVSITLHPYIYILSTITIIVYTSVPLDNDQAKHHHRDNSCCPNPRHPPHLLLLPPIAAVTDKIDPKKWKWKWKWNTFTAYHEWIRPGDPSSS